MLMDNELRDFSPKTEPQEGGEKPVYLMFKLAGETFHALPEAPAGVLSDLLAGVNVDSTGNRIYSAPNLISFMVGILRDKEPLTPEEAKERDAADLTPAEDGFIWVASDDVRRFERVVYGKQHIVKIDELGELVMYLGERLANRPTQLSARYGRGQRGTTTT